MVGESSDSNTARAAATSRQLLIHLQSTRSEGITPNSDETRGGRDEADDVTLAAMERISPALAPSVGLCIEYIAVNREPFRRSVVSGECHKGLFCPERFDWIDGSGALRGNQARQSCR
jgi:hypothetical protein